MSLHWKPLSEYPSSQPDVLFWIEDGVAAIPVYGRWDEDEACVLDTNDFGFTGYVVGWTEFTPPQTTH
jgi:hypothetical protein